MEPRNIYPISTISQERFVAVNEENARQYAAAFITAGRDFSVTYARTTDDQEQIDVWLFKVNPSK